MRLVASVALALPPDAALHVTDATPPETGLRIDCPPNCVYVSDSGTT